MPPETPPINPNPAPQPETNPMPDQPLQSQPVMAQPVPTANPAAEDPGKSLSVFGLILAFLVPLAGLIVSIVAASKSKKAGFKNGTAKLGIILSIIFTVLSIASMVLVLRRVDNIHNVQIPDAGPLPHQFDQPIKVPDFTTCTKTHTC